MLKKFTFLLIFTMCFLLGGEAKFSKIPFENNNFPLFFLFI